MKLLVNARKTDTYCQIGAPFGVQPNRRYIPPCRHDCYIFLTKLERIGEGGSPAMAVAKLAMTVQGWRPNLPRRSKCGGQTCRSGVETPRPATGGREGAQAELVRRDGGDGRLKKVWV
jgi:hypothetical protein